MDAFEKHAKEGQEILEKWSWLKDVSKDTYIQQQMAILVENQHRFHEAQPSKSVLEDIWRRCAIHMAHRVFTNILLHKIVSVQACSGPCSLVYLEDLSGHMHSYERAAKTKRLQPLFPLTETQSENTEQWRWSDKVFVNKSIASDFRGNECGMGLDAECELLLMLCEQMSNCIAREVCTDLMNHAGTKIESPKISRAVLDGVSAMQKKGVVPNWAVVNEVMAQEVLSSQTQRGEIFEAGVYELSFLKSHMKLYVDKKFPDNKILLGYKGNSPYQAGYVYAPYVPFTLWGPAGPEGIRQIVIRYSKMLNNPEYYAAVEIK